MHEIVIHAGECCGKGLHGKRETVQDRSDQQPLERERQEVARERCIVLTKGTMGAHGQ